ncbi:MAG TPA: MnhB domain-containing protein [Candidatus Baltobacteraceae bacterium]|nr:MnhB domain-containing protein [Candidatus Baltobacteraceae bacterium]
MSPRARGVLAAISGLALLLVVLAGFAKLPDFGVYLGPYGTLVDELAPIQRKIPNAITAVNFDYRGLDTMGEEFILFAAVAGLTLVLRKDRRDTTDAPLPSAGLRGRADRSDAIRAFGLAGIAVTIAFGVYVAIHPHLTPGGGFQGGTITSGFAALIFLALGYRPLKRYAPHQRTEPIEAIGAAGYVLVGVATLAAAGAFLANCLPLGASGEFFSTGTIPVINLCVAVEVVAGFVVVFGEFADETRFEVDDEAEVEP